MAVAQQTVEHQCHAQTGAGRHRFEADRLAARQPRRGRIVAVARLPDKPQLHIARLHRIEHEVVPRAGLAPDFRGEHHVESVHGIAAFDEILRVGARRLEKRGGIRMPGSLEDAVAEDDHLLSVRPRTHFRPRGSLHQPPDEAGSRAAHEPRGSRGRGAENTVAQTRDDGARRVGVAFAVKRGDRAHRRDFVTLEEGGVGVIRAHKCSTRMRLISAMPSGCRWLQCPLGTTRSLRAPSMWLLQ